MKRFVKRALQLPIAAATPFIWRVRSQPSLLILMYHRVLPSGHHARRTEQPGMYVAPETLAMHVRVLQKHFQLVHLDDWVSAVSQHKAIPKNACAITFDDGWLDNYEHAYPVLAKLQCPATIYLVSDLVGTRYEFWPNRLSELLVSNDASLRQVFPEWLVDLADREELLRHSMPQNYIERVDAVVSACKHRCSDAEMIDLLDGVAARHLPAASDRNLINWSEAKAMTRDDLVRFGSHSRRHTRLTEQLDGEIARDEVVNSADVIEKHLGKRPATFCYPNGDVSAYALETVRNHYAAAVTTRRGWNGSTSDRYLLNRVGVHDDIANDVVGFLSRLGS